ncbi:lipid phosphate phosphatase gamma-like [Musa acuminata AAA Group]|uniref:lipid phosphate phosphatase gamma-like n=1 Tax=Musa acuminata AAA Group TaxID=214697 RepID=UPI0031E2C614
MRISRASTIKRSNTFLPSFRPRPLPADPVPRSRPVATGKMEDAPAAALKAVTLTHVRYPQGDSLGHFLAWVSLILVFISFGGFISHFIFWRELQGLCFALGLIISQVINELIKSSIHQSRPSSMCAILEVCDSHGWPSSHSQFIFFFSTYFSLLCLINGVGVSSPSSRRIIALLPWPSAFLTLNSRVYLGYHTVPQVLAGSTLGLLLGAGWYWIVNTMLVDFFPAVEESAIGRFLYIKDSTHIPNVLKFEYDNARAARKKPAKD